MFIVLLDEPVLFVFDSETHAADAIEPPDAETEIRAAFDDEGVPYRVEWITPNEHKKLPTLFGSVSSVAFGEYQFVPAGPADLPALIALLEDYSLTQPPEAKPSVDALLSRVRAERDRPIERDDAESEPNS
jgi:hypothetical protein